MTSLSSNQKSETEKDAENNLSTFLIIDQDELSKNDAQVIQKIIDDYDRRLQEQIGLAKQDFVNELDRQFQVSCVCGFLVGFACYFHFLRVTLAVEVEFVGALKRGEVLLDRIKDYESLYMASWMLASACENMTTRFLGKSSLILPLKIVSVSYFHKLVRVLRLF